MADNDVSSVRIKEGTKTLLNEERLQKGRRMETDDELVQRIIKEVREYRRRCG